VHIIRYTIKTLLSYLHKEVDCFYELDVDGNRIILIRIPVAVSSTHLDKKLICIRMKISYRISEY